jgi:hypothetical protein
MQVKGCLFIYSTIKGEKMYLPGKDLEYTENKRLEYRNVIREARTYMLKFSYKTKAR